MQITRIEAFRRKNSKVYIDGDYAFWLYNSELRTYELTEGMVLSETVYNEIIRDVILIRVKKKALSLLERSDNTESQLRFKLTHAGYTEWQLTEAINYVNSYHYIDDRRFAANFIKSNFNSRSRLYIISALSHKGIDKQEASELYDELCNDAAETDLCDIPDGTVTSDVFVPSPELTALRKEIAKKVKNNTKLSYEEKAKLCASLCRKGFSYDMIQKELSFTEEYYND